LARAGRRRGEREGNQLFRQALGSSWPTLFQRLRFRGQLLPGPGVRAAKSLVGCGFLGVFCVFPAGDILRGRRHLPEIQGGPDYAAWDVRFNRDLIRDVARDQCSLEKNDGGEGRRRSRRNAGSASVISYPQLLLLLVTACSGGRGAWVAVERGKLLFSAGAHKTDAGGEKIGCWQLGARPSNRRPARIANCRTSSPCRACTKPRPLRPKQGFSRGRPQRVA